MKQFFLVFLAIIALSLSAQCDDKLRLSREDAKQVHAFFLTGELLDFAKRSNSASSYLMACELILDYPPENFSSGDVLKYCNLARTLAAGDTFLEDWISRVELRARKTIRSVQNPFALYSGELEAGQELHFEGNFNAAWTKGEDLVLSQDRDSRWSIRNESGQAKSYRVLLRKGPPAEGESH